MVLGDSAGNMYPLFVVMKTALSRSSPPERRTRSYAMGSDDAYGNK